MTEQAIPWSGWRSGEAPSRRPLHLTFQSTGRDPLPNEAALRAALGTSVPSYWIGPSTFELALSHMPALRRDPVHVDPDVVVVRERDEGAVLEFQLRVRPGWLVSAAAMPIVWSLLALDPATPQDVPPVAELAADVKAISGLSDEALAQIFPVTREHFCRWRMGREVAPSEANLRQLVALRQLLRDLRQRVDSPKAWLRAPIENGDGATSPYELLRRARLEDVWHLVEAMPSAVETRYRLDEEGGWTASPSAAVPYDHEPDDSPSIPLDWDDED